MLHKPQLMGKLVVADITGLVEAAQLDFIARGRIVTEKIAYFERDSKFFKRQVCFQLYV